MNLNLFNETDEKLDEEIKDIKKTMKYAVEKLELGEVEFNIIIVDNEYIHNLNKNYRNIDRPTDVITFALEDDKTFDVSEYGRVLGDVYISIDRAREQAEEYGHSLKREICFLATHGLLHLLGYDHMKPDEEKIMFSLQEEILSELGINR